jgi:hypothetical protein
LPAHPSHTTVRTELYTAVRRVKLRPGGELRQAERIKEGLGQDLADRRVLAEPPRPEVAAGGFLRPLATHPALLQLRPPSWNVLPLRSQHRPQPAPYPRIKVYKHPGCLAEPEVAPPPPEVGQKFTHHFLQAHSPCPPRQFPHSLLKPDLRLRRNPPHHVCKGPPRQMALCQEQPVMLYLLFPAPIAILGFSQMMDGTAC